MPVAIPDFTDGKWIKRDPDPKSVFSLSDKRETAHRAGEILKEHFNARGIACDVYVVKVTNKGAKLLAQ